MQYSVMGFGNRIVDDTVNAGTLIILRIGVRLLSRHVVRKGR